MIRCNPRPPLSHKATKNASENLRTGELTQSGEHGDLGIAKHKTFFSKAQQKLRHDEKR